MKASGTRTDLRSPSAGAGISKRGERGTCRRLSRPTARGLQHQREKVTAFWVVRGESALDLMLLLNTLWGTPHARDVMPTRAKRQENIARPSHNNQNNQ